MLPRKALIGLMVVALVGFVSAAFAAEGKDVGGPRPTDVKGTVKAAPADAKHAATVETIREMTGGPQKVTMYVTNDEQGKKLAKEADGKTAEIKGVISIDEKAEGRPMWLTVKEFKIVEEKK